MAKSGRDSIHDEDFAKDPGASDSHVRLYEADRLHAQQLLDQGKALSELQSQMTAIKWLFTICVGLLASILFGGFGWAWSMQGSVAAIQKDVAVQAVEARSNEASRKELSSAVKDLNTAVQELRLKIRE